jgi:SMODS and SLOG-associating 2TM effector domain 3/SMODS and SLOG-associating 2TM effector domain 1
VNGFAETDYPALYLAADVVSNDGQRVFVLLSRLELILLILAAGIGVAISFAGVVGNRILAASAAVLLFGALIVRSVARSSDPSKRWFEGRAVAESVKTLAWKYMACANPMTPGNAHADDVFTGFLGEVIAEHAGLAAPRTVSTQGLPQQITPAMRHIRKLPFEERRTTYLEQRVRDQLRWYSKRAREHKRRSDFWFVVGVVSEMAAIAYAVLLVVTPSWPNVIGLLATFTAASATLARLRGDNEVSQRYGLAAQELAMIQHRLEASTTHTFSERVMEAEAAISREHKMWAVKHA